MAEQAPDAQRQPTGPPEADTTSQADKDQTEQQAPKKRRRRWIIIIILVVLVAIGLAVGIPYYLYSWQHISCDDAFIDGHLTLISPRVTGYVLKVAVQDNQWVSAGDLLVELDARDFQARLESAQAALSMAQSGLSLAQARAAVARSSRDQSQAEVTVAQASAEAAKAEVAAAQAQAELDQRNLERSQQLYRGQAITAQQLDQAQAQARTSQANLEAARRKSAVADAQVQAAQAAFKTAQDNVTAAEAQVGQARAGVEQAQATVEQARLELSYTRVTAPKAGHVTHRTIESGMFIQAGQPMLAVVPLVVWVTANYKETELTHMQPGQPAKISVDAYPNVTFEGHVDSIQYGTGARFSLLPPENATGNYIKVVQRVPVKIVFDEMPDPGRYQLAPGMSVVPTVNVSKPPAETPPATMPATAPATAVHG